MKAATCITTYFLAMALLLVLEGGVSALADQIIYLDGLTGTGNVAASPPTIGGTDGGINYSSSEWTSNSVYKSTRGNPAAGRESNFLPFTPQPGRVYVVNATIDSTAWASTEWYTVGFVQSNAAWVSMGNLLMGTLVRGTNTATTPHSATVTVTLDTRGIGWVNPKSYSYVGLITDVPGTTGPKISNFSLVIQNPCTVTYDGNANSGGAVPVDSNVYSSGATVTVLGNTGSLTKTGFMFTGWNAAVDGTGTNFSPGSPIAVNGNTTLYAQWIHQVSDSSSTNAYVVSASDLLQTTGLSSVSNALTVNAGENNTWSHGTLASLTDGTFGEAGANGGLCISDGTVTYNLNTNLNPGGYTITHITSYSGWKDSCRANQNYTVSFCRVGSSSFVDSTVVSYAYIGGSPSDTQVTRGLYETNVVAIRFDFSTPAQQNGGVGYKELDVFGYGAAPVKQLAEIAAGIRAVTTPMRGSTNLVLPSVPSGYAISIKSSSNPGVIGTNGVINPPLTSTVLQLVLTVTQLSNNQTVDTGVISLFVPASTGTAPWISYTENFKMRRGLFMSWGAPQDGQTNPVVFSDGSRSTTINQFTLSANVPAVVNQIANFGFEYVYLQDFHGYQTTLHPCAALDSWRGPGCTSTRDLVGEFIAAFKARGIRVFLFTHPLDGWDGYTLAQQALVGFLDPTGNYQTWNDYINDVYAELTERYGDDIAGFGFDSDFGMSGNDQTYQKLDMPRLRQTILSRRPQLCLSALGGPNATAEMGIKEVYKPSWLDPWGTLSDTNYNVEVWPSYRRVPFVVQGYHWATVVPPAQGVAHMTGSQLFRYSVLQAAVATEGPGICWSVSPYTDGTWENGVAAAFTDMAAYIQPVEQSMTDVLPSTSYPLVEGVSLSTLPNGVAATRSSDDTIEYLHVLNPPSGNTLVLPLPSDGKQFMSPTLLGNGHAVTLVTDLSQVRLTLNAGDNWISPDTVVKLLVNPTTIPQRSLAFHKHVFASSSWDFGSNWGSLSPWAAIRLVDGITVPVTGTNGWSAGNYGFSTAVISNGFSIGLSPINRPESITLDLETTNSVSSVRLTPRNDSGNVGNGCPVDFAISTSLDGVNWTLASNLTSQPMATTAQTFTFVPRIARYVSLYATQLRVNSGGTYGLQLSELEVFGVPFTILPAPPTIASAVTATGTAGCAFAYQIAASNSPNAYGASGLPPGLTVDAGSGLVFGTPMLSGTFTIVVTASNSGGNGSANVLIALKSAYSAWAGTAFGSNASNPALAGDTISNNPAGIANLLCYATGANPFTPGTAALPVCSTATVSGACYLSLNLKRNSAAVDVTYTIEAVSNIAESTAWAPIATFSSGAWSGPAAVTESGDGPILGTHVVDTAPIGTTPQRFLRLKVSR